MTVERSAYAGNCQAVYGDVKNVIDDDDQPTSEPWRGLRWKTGFAAFGPGRTAWPRPIFQPCNVAGQLPAINEEMCAADDGKSDRILCDKEKWQQIKSAMYQGSERPLYFLFRHPVTLQQVITDGVR